MALLKALPVDKINRHLSLLGYAGSDLHKLINKWHRSNGSEWTVQRLKMLKSHFIHLLANQTLERDWIAFNKDGFPKGPFGRLLKLGIKKPKMCLSVLNTYLVYTSPPVKKQKDVISNISKQISEDHARFVKSQFDQLRFDKIDENYFNYIFKGISRPEKLKIDVSTSLNTSKPFLKDDERVQWLASIQHTSRKILPTEEVSCAFIDKGTFDVELFGGELTILPERGNKARVIASPHAELQVFLKPLHDALGDCLKAIPEDCTFDQIKGAKFAQEALKRGKTVHSVDLSAATDRFPLELQVGLLRKLNKDAHNINWASIFRRSALLKWRSPYGDIHYGAGQPMGLYGSFNLFAITHHAILHTLCRDLGLNPRPYRILGDDIVITDDSLALKYKTFMNNLGVEVSASKTITSNVVAEFAGFLITKGQLIKAAKPPKEAMTVGSMINYIKTLGKNPFTGPLQDLGEVLRYLPEPYGAGVNPRGLSKAARLNFYMSGKLEEIPKTVSANIETHLFAHLRDNKVWNPFLRSYDPSMEVNNAGANPSIEYFVKLANQTRTELERSVAIGDSRFKREHLLNNGSESKFVYRGSLGRVHRKVEPDKYVSQEKSWYKKLFGFFPWGIRD